MKKQLRIINIEEIAKKVVNEDHKIGDQIFLIDEYVLSPVEDYEFVAPDNLFIEVIKGNGFVIINGNKYIIDGPCLISYIKGQMVRVQVSGQITIQRGLIVVDDFILDLSNDAQKFSDIRTSIIRNPVISLDENDMNSVNMYVTVLRNLAKGNDNPYALICSKYLTLSLLFGPLYHVLERKLKAETTRSPSISSKFFTLLQNNFLEKHNLSFYSESLNISKTYLYQCVTSTSGKSPSYWLDYFMVSFAKNCLADTDISISQIARMMNFAGLPQFSKFFKKQTGISPLSYRKSIIYN